MSKHIQIGTHTYVEYTGSISKEEYMMAFSQAAETFALEDTKTHDEKSRLFELYDVDNSGTMDREEFAHLLLMHFLAVQEGDAAGAAEPQSCPSRQIDPTGAILISIAFFASEALKLNTKPIVSIKKNFEYFICYRFMKIERAAL